MPVTPCTPGTNYVGAATGLQVDYAASQTPLQDIAIAALDTRISQNALDIDGVGGLEHESRIQNLEGNWTNIGTQYAQINGSTLETFSVASPALPSEAMPKSELETTFAKLNGDNAIQFLVADPVLLSAAITLGYTIAKFAKLNGNSAEIFQVANAINLTDALPIGQADLKYLTISGKASDSDKLDGKDSTAFVEQTQTATTAIAGIARAATAAESAAGTAVNAYVTPDQLKAAIDAHNAILSPPAHT